MVTFKQQILESAGDWQLYAGQRSGCKAVVHALESIKGTLLSNSKSHIYPSLGMAVERPVRPWKKANSIGLNFPECER